MYDNKRVDTLLIKDMEVEISGALWANGLKRIKECSVNARLQLIWFKVLHRLHFYKTKPGSICLLSISSLRDRCKAVEGTLGPWNVINAVVYSMKTVLSVRITYLSFVKYSVSCTSVLFFLKLLISSLWPMCCYMQRVCFYVIRCVCVCHGTNFTCLSETGKSTVCWSHCTHLIICTMEDKSPFPEIMAVI